MLPATAPAGMGNVGAHRLGVVREHAWIGDMLAVRILGHDPGCRSTMFQASDSKQKGAALADLLHLLPVPLQQVGEGGALAERLAMGPQRAVRLPGAASIRRPADGDQASPVRIGGTCPAGGCGWGRCTLMIRSGDGG